MTKNTSLLDGTGEIGIGQIFITGRKVIGVAAFVVSDWRLEEIPAHVSQISAGVIAGANYIVDAIRSVLASVLQALPGTGGRGVHSDPGAAGADRAVRFAPGPAQGMSHRGAGVSVDLGTVTDDATACAFCGRLRGRWFFRRGCGVRNSLASCRGKSRYESDKQKKPQRRVLRCDHENRAD